MAASDKQAKVLERRVKGRAAMMGLSLTAVAKLGGVSLQSLVGWLSSGQLTGKARRVLKYALAVDDDWLDSESFEDVGNGLNVLMA